MDYGDYGWMISWFWFSLERYNWPEDPELAIMVLARAAGLVEDNLWDDINEEEET